LTEEKKKKKGRGRRAARDAIGFCGCGKKVECEKGKIAAFKQTKDKWGT
jgi:hypothetical protein